jgi:hypothetical protein
MPAWFLTRDYSHLQQLDAKGWYDQLTRLCKLSIDKNLGLFKGDPNIVVFSRLGKPGEATETTIGQIGVPTVQFIGPREEGFRLPLERLPALVVNVEAPDEVIQSELKLWLKEVRKYVKPPVAKRGQYALNYCYDEDTFAKWRADKIVEFAELLAWRATLDEQTKRRYREHVLGEWVGKESARTTSEAKATLKRALASLPALAAQIAHDMVPAQTAQEMIGKYVKRHR